MTLYKSRKGEIGDRAYWEKELISFWGLFESKYLVDIKHRLPSKPDDAFERFSRVIGLEVFDASSFNNGVNL